MKNVLVLTVALALAAPAAFAADAPGAPTPAAAPAAEAPLKNDKEKVGYVIGLTIGNSLKRDDAGDSVDVDAIARGLRTGLSGEKPILTDDEIQKVMQAFQETSMARRATRARELSEKNKKAGEEYLAANKTKPGVTTTASGLQYRVVTAGAGASPKPTDVVTVHYRGTLVDGTEFDSSYSRNEPATFPVNGVIQGWQEALPLMKLGSKWQIVLPSELAYGERGSGQEIGPNSVLLFDVELLKIVAEPQGPGAEGAPKPEGGASAQPTTKPAVKPATQPKTGTQPAKPAATPKPKPKATQPAR